MFRIGNVEDALKEKGFDCEIWCIRPGGYLAVMQGRPVEYTETSSADNSEIARVFIRKLHYRETGEDIYAKILAKQNDK